MPQSRNTEVVNVQEMALERSWGKDAEKLDFVRTRQPLAMGLQQDKLKKDLDNRFN